MKPILQLHQTLEDHQHQLSEHPLHHEISTLEHVQIFMKYHIFETWDFMSLIKCFQQLATCLTIPWLPNEYRNARRLANELALKFESSSFSMNYLSQFELLYTALMELKADLSPINDFIKNIEHIVPVKLALKLANAPEVVQQNVLTTMDIIEHSPVHVKMYHYRSSTPEDLSLFHLKTLPLQPA